MGIERVVRSLNDRDDRDERDERDNNEVGYHLSISPLLFSSRPLPSALLVYHLGIYLDVVIA